MVKVRKRDGRLAIFDENKIYEAVIKAFVAVDGKSTEYAEQKAHNISSYIKNEIQNFKEIDIEKIQDYVEKGLMSCKRKDVARAYISYRNERNLARKNTTDDTINNIIGGKDEYWMAENSNKDGTVASTQRDYMAGAVSTDISRRILLPKDITEAHDKGLIHFHDIDYFAQHIHNCDLVNLEDMLQNGTVINKTLIEKPHSFSTACNIATQIMAVVASGQYGW